MRVMTHVYFDSAGNVYIADTLNQRVRKITASTGIIDTIAGGGDYDFEQYNTNAVAATSAYLDAPSVVAIDSSGSHFVCLLLHYIHSLSSIN